MATEVQIVSDGHPLPKIDSTNTSTTNKMANAIGFYCNTQNFVAISGFSAMIGDFGCKRVPCCHQNHSVAIKILIVAIRWGIRNEKNMRCM
jgi:hypothetical protein